MFRTLAVFTFVLPVVVWANVNPPFLGIDQALTEFSAKPAYQATEQDIRAIELDFEARDVVLEPDLELSAKRYRDRSEAFATVSKTESQVLSATLHKPFSTGTEIFLTPNLERALLPALTPSTQNNFSWEIGISQNLWQDFFGRSTRLRWRREESEKAQALANALIRRASLTIEFETLYWDWAFALRETELREVNFRRSEEIYSWVQGRFKRSAAEVTDMLQARALKTNRELQLAAARQNLVQAELRMQRYVPGAQWRPQPDELAVPRRFEDLLTPWAAEELTGPLKLELLAARGESQAAAIQADEAREGIRPQLALEMIYSQNGVDPAADLAVRQSINQSHDYASIGLVFRSGLDLSREYKKVESARALKASAELRRVSLESDGRVAWASLQEQVRELRSRVGLAKSLVDIQTQKNEAEKRRYRTGRTTAFEAITFEQDAADAELALWTLYSVLKKTEAQARFYAR